MKWLIRYLIVITVMVILFGPPSWKVFLLSTIIIGAIWAAES